MLEAAQLRPGEVVYDLGCGDGRVLITAIQKFKAAKAIGVEISAKIVRAAMDTVRSLGLQDRAKVIHGNLMDQDVSDADVVTLYLLTSSNEILRPKLEKGMKPGSRVVSHDFEVKGWKPDRVEKAYSYNRLHTIYVYQMPPHPVTP
jgi:ubiquinone/menaquinone biosynthesis C-methylase UbiE